MLSTDRHFHCQRGFSRDPGGSTLDHDALPKEKSADALQIALRAARENETRWMEISPEFSDDGERMEQWASTAKLRRIEIERIETLLAEVENPSPGPTLR